MKNNKNKKIQITREQIGLLLVIGVMVLVFISVLISRGGSEVLVAQCVDDMSDLCCEQELGVKSFFDTSDAQCKPLQEKYTRVDHGNPATDYCVEQGGVIRIEDTLNSEIGICMFVGGAECEQWDFYNGLCE